MHQLANLEQKHTQLLKQNNHSVIMEKDGEGMKVSLQSDLYLQENSLERESGSSDTSSLIS